jgi:pimeloyl-ACP methyl ester carboxylesterase
MDRFRTTVTVVAVMVAATALASPVGASPAAGGHAITVGSERLTPCAAGPSSYCGKLAVPLDYRHPRGATITIAYRWYPASSPVDGVASGTVLPVEGGPGFPSIGSVPGGYRVMYGPLLHQWNMLAIDLRGTGSSAPLDCPALQNFTGRASGPTFNAVVGDCAAALDHRWRTPTGAFVHASDLFTSATAAADVASVVRALGLQQVDVYGDSYGSFFAQVFARRYPALVRSLTLDSTYATEQLDPWYRSTIESIPTAFDTVCDRSPACAGAATGASWPRIEALADRLRTSPVTRRVPGPDGAVESVTMDVVGLVDLVSDAAGDPSIYRSLDAAARADLADDDPAPLLRLYAQRLAFDEDYFATSARAYSGELYFAVSCLDYPQLFDMSADASTRMAQLQSAAAALPPGTFAPFTTAEWLSQNENTEAYSACVSWPSPRDAGPPTAGQPPLPASTPVLILGGELDTWTPPSGISQVTGELGGTSRVIVLANATHVVGEADTICGSQLVEAFVAAPSSLDTLDASCAARVPTIHAVGIYARSLTEVPPLTPSPGTTGSQPLLRLAAASVATAGDAVARYQDTVGTFDHGLHGGTARAQRGGKTITLTGDTLVPGVPVSGIIRTSSTAVTATLTAHGPGSPRTTFTVRWPLGVDDAMATVTGTSRGRTITGEMDAP